MYKYTKSFCIKPVIFNYLMTVEIAVTKKYWVLHFFMYTEPIDYFIF